MMSIVERRFSRLYVALGHSFARPEILDEALTHPSATNAASGASVRPNGPDYERLEFLGDRVLGLVVSQMLLERFPQEKVGALARRHTALVRAEALATVARHLKLGEFMNMAPSEDASGGRDKTGNLADCCEAVIAALYRDGGMLAAEQFIRKYWKPLLRADAKPPQDAKTALQEWAQGRGLPLPEYTVVDQSGPDHAPLFTIVVNLPGIPKATATGASKRLAEQKAASALLALIERRGRATSR